MRYANSKIEHDIKKRQRMLIPVNIVLCIICIVAIVTLYMLPILKIDLGKIVSDEEVSDYISNHMQSSSNTSSTDTGKNATFAVTYDESSSDSSSEAMSSVVAPIMKTVLKTFADKNISLSVTPKQASKCAFDSSTDTVKQLLDDVLFNEETGFVTSLVKGIERVFKENSEELENSALTGMARYATQMAKDSLSSNSEAYAVLNNFSDDEINSIVSKLDGLDEVTNEDEFKEVIGGALDQIEYLANGQYNFSEADREQIINNNLLPLYTATMEEIEKYNSSNTEGEQITFSLETFLCVQLSKNVDLSNITGSLLNSSSSSTQKNNEISAKTYAYVTYADAEGENVPDEEGENTEDGNDSESSENEYTICYSYSDVLEKGFKTDTLSADIQTSFNESFGTSESTAEIAETLSTVMKYLFIVVCVFMAIWAIQFLFAFIHIFAGNKFVGMWYTKLFCWIPVLLWAITLLLSNASFINMIFGLIGSEEAMDIAGLIVGVFKGITSFTFVSGICYVALWLVSIFWAFPIKRGIRRLKKENKALLKHPQTASD